MTATITYTPSGGSAITLADENASVYLPRYGRRKTYKVDVVEPARATWSKGIGRGLAIERVSFTVEKAHATFADAASFIDAQHDGFPLEGTLVRTIGSTTITWHACVEDVDSSASAGVSSIITYTFVCDKSS